ncbi:sulfite oxidase-like oxidoreductase [Anaerolineales bacterium]
MGVFDNFRKRKEEVEERRNLEQEMKDARRLPPGQSLTTKFPVLTYGPIPKFDPETWDLRVFGAVQQEARWSWDEFLKLPTVKRTVDIHCVTRWSQFDMDWEGVLFKDFIDLFGLTDEAKFVIAHCDYSYTTNLPLQTMLDDDVLLAYKYDGKFLTPEHGAPLRTLVPKRYFWKSAKFLRALEFSPVDKPGFWEKGGYHNEGDPFQEDRYGKGMW